MARHEPDSVPGWLARGNVKMRPKIKAAAVMMRVDACCRCDLKLNLDSQPVDGSGSPACQTTGSLNVRSKTPRDLVGPSRAWSDLGNGAFWSRRDAFPGM